MPTSMTDEHRDVLARGDPRGRCHLHVQSVVGAGDDLGAAVQGRDPVELLAAALLVRDEHAGMPWSTMTWASDGLAQMMPSAPSSIWRRAICGDLWALL